MAKRCAQTRQQKNVTGVELVCLHANRCSAQARVPRGNVNIETALILKSYTKKLFSESIVFLSFPVILVPVFAGCLQLVAVWSGAVVVDVEFLLVAEVASQICLRNLSVESSTT